MVHKGYSCCSQNTCLYFAYGANMCRETLSKRGVQPVGPPRRARTLESDGWQIAFAHRAGYATLMKRDDDSMLQFPNPHGVLYTLNVDDLRKIESREVGYKRDRIRVLTYNSDNCNEDEIVEDVNVFVSVPWMVLRLAVAPTERYIGLLRQGAVENGLDGEYVAWLEAVPSVEASKLSQDYSYNDTLSEAVAKGVALVMLALVCGAALLS